MGRIIGITGLAGAGKDSFAGFLEYALAGRGWEVRTGSFAEPIRQISAHMGLEPYDRAQKEQPVWIDADDFRDKLYEGIESVLAERMEPNDRAHLYCYTVEVCDKFTRCTSKPGGTLYISPRQFMQVLGTEGGQRVRKTLWVDMARQLWQVFPGYVLVTDMRFEHEAKIADLIFNVNRPGVVPVNDHPSEKLAAMLNQGRRPAFIPLDKLNHVENFRDLAYLQEVAQECVPIVTSI